MYVYKYDSYIIVGYELPNFKYCNKFSNYSSSFMKSLIIKKFVKFLKVQIKFNLKFRKLV